MDLDEYDSEGTARAVVNNLTETLGVIFPIVNFTKILNKTKTHYGIDISCKF